MSEPLGDEIARLYLQEMHSLVARYRSGKVHLMDRDVPRAKCGAQLLINNYSLSKDTELGRGEAWCYSCLGNALEWIERDRAHLH